MLFSSLEFLLFFPVVLLGFYGLSPQYRWAWLLAASYFFYASWQIEYLSLVLLATLMGYTSSVFIAKSKTSTGKALACTLGVAGALAPLLFFKYQDFFLSQVDNSYKSIEDRFGWVLPVGISFFTFQTLSYIIDVYRQKREVEKHFGTFALYVSFFPQLVAGPIERSTSLLPQLKTLSHKFDYERIQSGAKLILWGLFKKLVLADNLAPIVDRVYAAPEQFSSAALLVASLAFAFQIFCDFSAYSDMAVGTARMLGVRLMENFNRPYSATSIKDFWRRWHISLSSWFRDYLYIPLGGNQVKLSRHYFNLMVTFVISGLWHGANWTFILWGGIHGGLMIMEDIARFILPQKAIRLFNSSHWFMSLFKRVWVFIIVTIAWVFFRADSVSDGIYIIHSVTDMERWSLPSTSSLIAETGAHGIQVVALAVGFPVMFLVHECHRRFGSVDFFQPLARPLRWGLFYVMLFSVLLLAPGASEDFIYFQF